VSNVDPAHTPEDFMTMLYNNNFVKNKGGHGGICAINTKESHQTVYPQNDKANMGALEKSQWNTDKLL